MNNIKRLRFENNLSQLDLANAMHVTQTAVSQWETGRSNPVTQQLEALSDYFDVSVDYLLGKTDDPIKPTQSKPLVKEFPPELNGVQAAFSGGAGEGLNEDDIDMLVEMAERLRKMKQKK